ncbi:MAG: TIGR02710 family CRISPR-associated protein [Candidatus Hydrogenedentes bacterium]|nr:TIGR02710 family CRISPR-associated protein [Candidatus Hydrogenedentota bacterium]
MAKGLLLTVGASADSEIFCIKEQSPEWVAFLCTRGSRTTIDKIAAQTSLAPHQYQIFESPDSPEAVGGLVETAHKACRWLEEKCGANADITINPTAGRKWMSMGLGMFGSRTSARQIYVDVVFVDGKPNPDTMKIVDLGNAQDHTGLFDADLGVNLFNRGDFDGAAQVFGHIRPRFAAGRELYRGLNGLSTALHRWDRFEHLGRNSNVSEAGRESLGELETAAAELCMHSLKSFATAMGLLFERIRQVESAEKPSLIAIGDLAANAHRRIKTGRYDDAVARLYRALEAIAQVLLKKRGIDTSHIDWGRISAEQQRAYNACAREENEKMPVRVGLKQAFCLARSLHIPEAELFFNQQGGFCFEKHLGGRNNSILAHGWDSLDERQASKFAEKIEASLSQLDIRVVGWQVPEMPRLWT